VANKSIFEIDIQDEKAKAYFALVEKYQQSLAKMPGMWAKVALAEQPVVAALAAQTQLLSKVVDGEKQVANQAQRAEKSWHGISTHAQRTADQLSRITLSLAKWTGLTGALGAIVGAVSLDRIAGAVSGSRREAAGLGISYGQNQAFGLDLGRFVNAGAVLGASRNALFDITNPAFVGLRAAGVPQGAIDSGNAATVSAELLKRLPGLFANTPRGLILPQARALGIDQFLGNDDIVRYLGANPQERQKQLQQFQNDSQTLNLQDKVTRQWQDFSTALGRAELGIENTFVKGLAPLAEPLSKLAGSVERATATFLNGASKWLEPFGQGIEKLAKYLVSDEFSKDLDDFKESVGNIAESASKLAGAIKWVTDHLPGNLPKGYFTGGPNVSIRPGSVADSLFGGIVNNFKNARGFYGALDKVSDPAMRDLLGLVSQLENAKHDPNAVSKTGAVGLYQIEPGTARQYGRDPNKLTDPQYNTETASIILRDLVRRYHGDVDKVLAAYNSGPGRVDRGGPLPEETRNYVSKAHGIQGYQKVVVEIHDTTGGSAVTSAAQVGLGGAP